MCCLQNIALHDYQESVTTGQTDTWTDGPTDRHQTIRIYHNFVQGQGNPPEYQIFATSTTRQASLWTANL